MAKTRPRGAGAENEAIAGIQAEIARKGASWQAAATSMSALSKAEQQSHLGLQVTPTQLAATKELIAAANKLAAVRMAVAAPAAVDWRNNGGNFVTPIKDQSNCGSCVSFGTLATIEARVNIACRTPGGARDYSEAFLFYCGCGNCCDTGWQFESALNYCKETGVAAESAFPYTPGNQPCKSGVAVSFKISGYSTAASAADRKAALARGPVVAGLAVYQDFFSYTSGVYRHVSGTLAGYHAVSAVGYDDAQGCWICKNSWGTGWGDSGFFRIAYGEAEMDTSFLFYEPQVTCPTPTPVDDCSRYVPYLQRVLVVARGHSGLRSCLRYYVCRRGTRPYCSTEILDVVRVVISILNRCPQYRDSFCRLLGA